LSDTAVDLVLSVAAILLFLLLYSFCVSIFYYLHCE